MGLLLLFSKERSFGLALFGWFVVFVLFFFKK